VAAVAVQPDNTIYVLLATAFSLLGIALTVFAIRSRKKLISTLPK